MGVGVGGAIATTAGVLIPSRLSQDPWGVLGGLIKEFPAFDADFPPDFSRIFVCGRCFHGLVHHIGIR